MRIADNLGESRGKMAIAWHQDARSARIPGPSRKDLRRKRANYCRKPVKVIQVLAGPDYPPDEKRIRDLVVRSMKRSTDRAGMARHNALSALGLYQDRRAKLKTIKVPTVVVHGEKDPLMAVEGGKDTAANIPGAELRIIPGMGHDLPIPLVDTITDAITAAASRATGAEAAK